jgi:DNA-binding MurR/RpiR family transcriptional regulator
VTAALAPLGAHDAVVAIDLARYDVAVLDSVAFVAERGAAVIALTDSALSPLAGWATAVFAVSAEGAGPFDSHVGALVVANALASGVARRLKAGATRRLDAVERAWRDAGVLADS